MIEPKRGTVTQIDGHYIRPGYAAAYLLTDGEEAAFFDTITPFSVPDLLKALESQGLNPGQVRYIVASHCHLDHSSGTAELVKHCPEATVICHPRARKHLIDPTKLIRASRPVYGEDVFDDLFGEIGPIPEARVRAIEEGETLEFGRRTFTCLHTPGHAPHHMSLIDPENETGYTGDAYGLAYRDLQDGRRPYLGYVVSPGDFSAEQARQSIENIKATGVRQVYVTHFGGVDQMEIAAEVMIRKVDAYERIIKEAADTDLEGEALKRHCHEAGMAYIVSDLKDAGLDPEEATVRLWADAELNITASGLAVHAERLRKAAAEAGKG